MTKPLQCAVPGSTFNRLVAALAVGGANPTLAETVSLMALRSGPVTMDVNLLDRAASNVKTHGPQDESAKELLAEIERNRSTYIAEANPMPDPDPTPAPTPSPTPAPIAANAGTDTAGSTS